MTNVALSISLDNPGSVFNVGEYVRGTVTVLAKERISHNGISLLIEGSVSLHLSPKSVGIFDTFIHSIKPLQLIHLSLTVSEPGKLPEGKTMLPFEFELVPQKGSPGLFETYHGVFVNVQYTITADMQRKMFAKNLRETVPFVVRNLGQATENGIARRRVPFVLQPANLRNVRRVLTKVPAFRIEGHLDSAVCDITGSLTGEVCISECDLRIRSIELQWVRVEFCAAAEGVAKEATEIQNIQIAEGDVCRGLAVPMYMVFPRWFTCPTLVAQNFKVEFEVNLVILLEDNHQITENFPIRLYRLPLDGYVPEPVSEPEPASGAPAS